jgi:thioredoxin reductase
MGTKIITETVDSIDFSQRPFKLFVGAMEVLADTIILATGMLAWACVGPPVCLLELVLA